MSKRLVILGIGESGIGSAMLGAKLGWEVFLSDSATKLKPIFQSELDLLNFDYELGAHSREKILGADLIIKSPGIPDSSPLIQEIKAKGIEIISEIEWAYRNVNTDAKIIAITGSNGKSTTTDLTYRIFVDGGLDTSCVGNIGVSFARQLATNPTSYYILEISSFQLDDTTSFRPDIAVILNITPDHLDRYDYQMSLYTESKFKIAANQTEEDYLILNHDDEIIMQYLENQKSIKSKKIFFSMNRAFEENNNGASYINGEGKLIVELPGKENYSIDKDDIGIRGIHNLYNSMAAGIPARIMDIRNEKIRESMMDYKGIEHRLEFVAQIKGVEYINDSKATNVNSVWYALECMTKPTILILGGVDKGNDYGIIKDLIDEKVKAIVCLGVNNEPILNYFKDTPISIKEVRSMGSAVEVASGLAVSGDVVLLAPACASFDLFENYVDRGNQFKTIVKSL